MLNIPRKAIPISMEKLDLWVEANSRKHYSPSLLDELANNIKKNNLQNPLFVKKGSDGKYWIFCGQRRWEACRQIPLTKVDCVVFKNISLTNAKLFSLSENLYRESMTTDEISDAAFFLYEKHDKDIDRIAKILGVTTQTVKRYLDYHIVPDAVKKLGEKYHLKRNEVTKIYNKFPSINRANEVINDFGKIGSRAERKNYKAAIREASSSDDIRKLRARAKQLLNSRKVILMIPNDTVLPLERKAQDQDSTLEDKIEDILDEWVRVNV